MAKLTSKKTPSPARAEGNKFDKIVKENLEALLPVILHKIIGLDASCETKNPPALKLQVTTEKEPDFLKLIKRKGSRKWNLLHVEFETKDEQKTDRRMAFYHTLLYLILGLEVEQHLIYLLEDSPKRITGEIRQPNLTCTFKIHCISNYSYLEFINSDVPEEVLLAVLANPKEKTGEEIIRLILERLVQLRGNSLDTMKFIQQLKILSMLRKLRSETIKQVEEMKFTIPRELIEADGLFIEGMEKGMEKGLHEGMEKQAVVAIVNMLHERFGTQRIADILDVSHDMVLSIQQQLLQGPQILDLLRQGKFSDKQIAQRLHVSPFLVEIIREKKEG